MQARPRVAFDMFCRSLVPASLAVTPQSQPAHGLELPNLQPEKRHAASAAQVDVHCEGGDPEPPKCA